VLEISVFAAKPTQLIGAVLQRKCSLGMFGDSNSQDQTDAAVEGISLVNTAGELNWGLEELPDCSLKAATEEAGLRYMGIRNTQSALDPHRMYFTPYSKVVLGIGTT